MKGCEGSSLWIQPGVGLGWGSVKDCEGSSLGIQPGWASLGVV